MVTKERNQQTNRYGIAEARAHFGELVDRVYYNGEKIILEKSGKAMAMITPLTEEEVNAEEARAKSKERLWSAIDEIRKKVAESGMSQQEIEELVAEAVEWARAQPE